jgi:heavy metal sensor kinase
MRKASIRVRLTAWYSTVILLSLSVFAVFSWFAVKASLYHSIDETLRDRVVGVTRFMEAQIGELSLVEIRDEFKEHSVLGPGGDLFQVCDANGEFLYRSVPLVEADVPIVRPGQLARAQVFEDRIVLRTDLRFFSSRTRVLGRDYTVQVAAPMHEILEALARFRATLLILVPVALATAAVGGWWVSGRALRPVDIIIAGARSIGRRNIGSRLPVPDTRDELQRLCETLNEMLERLEQSFRRVIQFTADASHELRTPVSLIRTTAELALRKPRGEADHAEALREILVESERTTQLVEDLLALAGADASADVLKVQPVDLTELVRLAAEQGARLAESKGISFTTDLPQSPCLVTGEPNSLRRLLLILLDNALKYTPKGGCIEIRLSADEQSARISVHDSGTGIAPGDLPHIFDRFYRADAARSRDFGGAGLGLSLAQRIVKGHSGSIEVQSRAGEGSCFTVVLPR